MVTGRLALSNLLHFWRQSVDDVIELVGTGRRRLGWGWGDDVVAVQSGEVEDGVALNWQDSQEREWGKPWTWLGQVYLRCFGGRDLSRLVVAGLGRVGEDRISGSLGKRGFREKKEAAEALGGGRRGAEIFLKTIHGWRLFSHRQAWRVAQSLST